MTLSQRLGAEGLGTAFLLAVVVGSGVMAERLAGGNQAIALLANSLATGAGLFAILLTLGPVSGAHLNPAVSLALAIDGKLEWKVFPHYVLVQTLGAVVGVWAAHAMFGLPILEVATKARPGNALVFSEFVATTGLIGIVFVCSRFRNEATPAAVAAYITAAYWFTASTSFANPAVTVARSITDTFTGIAPQYVAGFVLAQIAAAILVSLVARSQTGTRTR